MCWCSQIAAQDKACSFQIISMWKLVYEGWIYNEIKWRNALAVEVMDVKYVGKIYPALAQNSQSGDRDWQCSKKQVPHEFKLWRELKLYSKIPHLVTFTFRLNLYSYYGIIWALLLNTCIELFQEIKNHDSVVHHSRMTIYESSRLMGWEGWTMASRVSV